MLTDLAGRMAELVVRYSVGVRKGDLVGIEGSTEAIPLMNEIFRQAMRAGGHPFTRVEVPGQRYIFLREAQPHQLAYESPVDQAMVEALDAAIKISSEVNPQELANIPPDTMRRASESQGRLMSAVRQRSATGALRFCYLPWPTSGQAQAANMSIEEFTAIVERSCFLDRPDPAAEWQKLSDEQSRICAFLSAVDRLRIVTEGTDLTMSVKGREWVNSAGKANLPDGEVYTGPVEDSANGVISFSFPARRAEGITLTLRDGIVVEHSARKGADHLDQMLQIPGADRLGEVAIGTNYQHQTYVQHILFDEKMGGTVHVALGAGFPETGSRNESALHWDLLTDMREDGRIYADGCLFYEHGRFLI